MFRQEQTNQQDTTSKPEVNNNSAADSSKNDAVQNLPKTKTERLPLTTVTDTVIMHDSAMKQAPVVSLFTAHELQPVNKAPVEKSPQYSGWITVLLLGCVLTITYLRVFYPKRLADFFRAVPDIRFALQLVREEKVLSQRASVFLMLVFFFTTSAFLFILNQYFNASVFSGNSYVVFLKIMFSIFAVFLVRFFLLGVTGFIFNAENEFYFYSFHVFLYNKTFGLALIPVLAGLAYANAVPQPVFIWTGIALFLITYSARLIRGLNIGMAKQGFNKLYLFFYFCTLEILPAAVLAKLILKHAA
ncbi:MAG: hypothetical protein POELPBGB_01856 [Bacteroidia bacterium]|nr:hypothetical protein [Bacteroidia bacterium]